ncbi:MAG: acetaldehyde dehydrogenase (acetylating) [Acidobacteriota bacterium]|nr:acetaldehyde dehydrogenase (acetylating) [Acidobacteriota bacterium]
MDRDLESIQQARSLLDKAFQAQERLSRFSQDQVDSVVRQMAEAALGAAEKLARMAVEETGFGNVADKILKNKFGSEFVHEAIKDLRTVGIIREDRKKGILEIASPVGVIAAIIPSTNPTSTTINKALIALKGRNTIVFSPHPSAAGCIQETSRLLSEAAVAAGAPEGSIGCLSQSTIEGTRELMSHRNTALILATGGHGLVKAAYSVGKPAFGVGPGNVPAYVESSADIPQAIQDIFTGKCFDNGTLCSSEQAIITDAAIKDRVIEEIKHNGGHFLNEQEIQALGQVVVTPRRTVNPKIVGKPAATIAALAGVRIPEGTRVLVAPLSGVGRDYPLSMEKLSPILAFYVEKDWEAACDRCIELLNYGGLGHTLAIHSKNDEIIRQFGLQKPVFRIVVNTQAALGAVGYTTRLFPSMTLGCGTLGGNITSDNISPFHLINIKRVAYSRTQDLGEDSSQAATAPRQQAIPANRGEVSALVDRLMADRRLQFQRPPQPAPPPARPTPPETPPDPPEPVSFVCEEDIRQAVKEDRKIHVDGKSIITPAARDLGNQKAVLVYLA